MPAPLIEYLVHVVHQPRLREFEKEIIIDRVGDIRAKPRRARPCGTAEHAKMMHDRGQHHLLAAEHGPVELVLDVSAPGIYSLAGTIGANGCGMVVEPLGQFAHRTGFEAIIRIQLSDIGRAAQ